MVVVVVLPDPFRRMGSWRNSTETQQSGHAPRSGPEVKNWRSGAKDGAPERLVCGPHPTIPRGPTIRSPPNRLTTGSPRLPSDSHCCRLVCKGYESLERPMWQIVAIDLPPFQYPLK